MEFSLEKLREGMAIAGLSDFRREYVEARWEKVKDQIKAMYEAVMDYWPATPSASEYPKVNVPDDLDEELRNVVLICTYCFLVPSSRTVYLAKGLTEENWRDNMPDLLWHMHDEDGKVWMDTLNGEFVWHISILNATNIKLGRLQFYPMYASQDYPQVGVKQGDHLIGFHIPACGPLTPESCLDAFDRARKFCATREPAWEFSHFFCRSWLFNPVYQKYLAPTSNIVRVQKLGIITSYRDESREAIRRVFTFGHEDVNTPNPRSSMQKAVQQILKNGDYIGDGEILFPREIR